MGYTPKTGDALAQDVAYRVSSVATLAALKAIPAKKRHEGLVKLVEVDNSLWRFHSSSSLTNDNALVAAPDSGSGRWLLCPGTVTMRLPITYATADATALLTLQAGQEMFVRQLYWEVSTNFTGGSSSAIGVSSNKTAFTTKGDLLGGATGDVAATLLAASSPAVGTVGAGADTVAKLRKIFVATDTVRFDRITSAFTAGAGNVCVVVDLLKNAGA